MTYDFKRVYPMSWLAGAKYEKEASASNDFLEHHSAIDLEYDGDY
jgi:hypothetical protein